MRETWQYSGFYPGVVGAIHELPLQSVY